MGKSLFVLLAFVLFFACRRQHIANSKTDSTVTTSSDTKAEWQREVTRHYSFGDPALYMPGQYPYLPLFDTSDVTENAVTGSPVKKGLRSKKQMIPVMVTETIRESGWVQQQELSKKQVQVRENEVQKEPRRLWPWISGILLFLLFVLVAWGLRDIVKRNLF